MKSSFLYWWCLTLWRWNTLHLIQCSWYRFSIILSVRGTVSIIQRAITSTTLPYWAWGILFINTVLSIYWQFNYFCCESEYRKCDKLTHSLSSFPSVSQSQWLCFNVSCFFVLCTNHNSQMLHPPWHQFLGSPDIFFWDILGPLYLWIHRSCKICYQFKWGV